MIVFNTLDTPLPPTTKLVSLTLGNFDGVHLGHLEILKRLTGTKVVITFNNHPTEVLNPSKKLDLICSIEDKIKLIESAGIDFLYLIPFTKEFAEQTPLQFLKNVRKTIPFDTLVLGNDAAIGKNKSGTKEVIQKIAKELNFKTEYVDDLLIDGKRPSSTLIRSLVKEGKIHEAERLLGRSFTT